VSITLPSELLAQAARLARPGEGRSSILARLLAAAVERELDERYADAYRRHPIAPEEDAFAQAVARQGFADAAR